MHRYTVVVLDGSDVRTYEYVGEDVQVGEWIDVHVWEWSVCVVEVRRDTLVCRVVYRTAA